MGRACNHRTLGRKPVCEHDLYANVEAVQSVMGDVGGTVYIVDPNHPQASNQHAGTDPNYPLRTVAQAISLCAAYAGDVIAVMMNSYWTYGNTAVGRATPIQEAVTVDVPGVRLVGVSKSPLGVPWIPTANNAVCITVSAMDVEIEGFNFWTTATTGNTGILAEWDGPPYGESLYVHDCYFYDLAYGIQLDYTWNCVIERCRFDDLATAAIQNPNNYGEPDYLTIRDCVFIGNVADIILPENADTIIEGCRFLDVTAAITMTGGAAHNTILDNTIEGDGTGTNNFINLTGGNDNLVSGNCLTCTIAQYDTTCSDATSGSWGGNHCSNGDTTAAPT